jgi:Holliday junction resolvasome RuvABC endonuclease subunit
MGIGTDIEPVVGLITNILHKYKTDYVLMEQRFESKQIIATNMTVEVFNLILTALKLMNYSVYRYPGHQAEDTLDMIIVGGNHLVPVIGVNYRLGGKYDN